ncbi:MAG: cytidylate kinase-like family protein [Acidobacteria bacterium]|nr:cytidylate kinase-like family protein [Acidobacteriota bacterium]
MPIVTIARGTFSGGRALAEELARKLGSECLDSEIVGEAARKLGVPVSRLKAAMMKAPASLRGFARERDTYLACVTAELCERAQGGDLVYHGHAAHLLLPGVSHVLRVRVVADPEFRIRAAMSRMNIGRNPAKKYIHDVDTDRVRWVDFLYGVDWSDPSHYDFVVNLEHVSVSNAAAAVCAMAELPEFKPTPVSQQRIADLLLGSRARVRLSVDPRTRSADVTVRASRGVLSVRHMPQQAHLAPVIRQALTDIPGIRDIHCAIASTMVLWIEEAFSPESAAFTQVVDLTRRWDAAVGLLKLAPDDAPDDAVGDPVNLEAVRIASLDAVPSSEAEDDGGVILDTIEPAVAPAAHRDQEMAATFGALLREGRSGETMTLKSSQLPTSLDLGVKYSLVIVGDIFRSKPETVRGRLTRELRSAIAEHLGVPVVGIEDLRQRLAFGPRQAVAALAGLVLVALTYALVFTNQEAVVRFLSAGPTGPQRVLAVAAVVVGTPLFAFVYGACVSRITKLLGFD